jgi:hypothetical protein
VDGNRRWVVVGAAIVLVAAGAIASALAFSGGSRARLTDASFPGYHLEFRYPSSWERHDWCWVSISVFPMTLLTTSHAAQPCQENSQYGTGTPLPPPQRVARNGVSAWWFASDPARPDVGRPNATLDGQPARITIERQSTRRTEKSYVNCRTGKTQQFLTALIHGPSSNVSEIEVGAVICGPDFATGEAAVREMLDSVRFTS